jgi:hypothetical protein
MEVGHGPNRGCNAKEKKLFDLWWFSTTHEGYNGQQSILQAHDDLKAENETNNLGKFPSAIKRSQKQTAYAEECQKALNKNRQRE